MEDTPRCGLADFLAPPLAPLVVPSPRLSQCLSQQGQLCGWKPLLGGLAVLRPWVLAVSQVLVALPGCCWARLQYLALLGHPGAPFSPMSVNAYALTSFLVLPACLHVPSPP